MAHLKNKTAHAIRTRSPPGTFRSLQGGGLVSPGWFGLFRLLRPCIGAEHMTKGRQNLYMIAHDLRDCQQWS